LTRIGQELYPDYSFHAGALMIVALSLALASVAASSANAPAAPQSATEGARVRVEVKKGGVDAAISSGTLGELLDELVRQNAIHGLVLDQSVRNVSIAGEWSARSAEDLLGKALAGRTDVAWAGRGDRIAVGHLDFVLKAWDVKENLGAPVGSSRLASAKVAEVKGPGEESGKPAVEVDEAAAAREVEEGAQAHEASLATFTAALTAPAAAPGTVLVSPFSGPDGQERGGTYVRGAASGPETSVITPFGPAVTLPKGSVAQPLAPPGSTLETLYRALGIR
jgi:hypothetical protein